ncbi:hypothetical protein [Amycolatopsis sp. NPDC004378]
MRAEVAVGGAIAVIALVTAVWVVVRRRRKPPGSEARAVLGDVPHAPLSAVRRDALLARIEKTFAAGRFCVLLGGSGAGKTHLAAAFARESRAPVVWVADPANAARAGLASIDALDDAVVVFDGATDPDALNRWLPARARVLVTTRVPDFEVLGGTVPVGGFEEAEAARFLVARAGEAAPEVARELGFLPLALAQAGAVIRRHGVAGYLERLPHTPPLEREPGEAHPAAVEDTTLAALRMVAARDSRALVAAELLAVLASQGTRRELAHRVGPDPVAVDAALAGLADASLAEFRGGVVVMHRLTQRAVLGRLHAEDRLGPALDRAFTVVETPLPAADLVDHAAALWRHFRALPTAEIAPRLPRILRMRRRAVDALVEAGALTQARTLGLEVLADHHAYLPAGHEDIAQAARSRYRAARALSRAG